MSEKKSIQISAPAALHLVDLIQEQVRLTESDMVKKILLRAGIKLLTELADTRFVSALLAVPTLKTGRPRVSEASVTPAAAPKSTPKATAARKPAA